MSDFLFLAGVACIVAGVYLAFGVAHALIAGGGLAIVLAALLSRRSVITRGDS